MNRYTDPDTNQTGSSADPAASNQAAEPTTDVNASDPSAGAADGTRTDTSDAGMERGAAPAASADAAAGASAEPSSMTALILGAVVVALLLIGGAWFVMSDDGMSVAEDPAAADLPANFDEGDPEEVVAAVNGNELTRAEFNRIRQQVLQNAQQQGMDLEDPNTVQQVNAQALDTLVNTELIRQAAVAAGVTVTDEEVDERYAQVVESVGGEEALAQSLEQLGLTEDSLRGDVEQELVVQAYLEQSIESDFSASDEEVQAFYDELGGSEAGLPPLEEVRGEIEQQLAMTEEQEVIEELLEELRAEAEVETMM